MNYQEKTKLLEKITNLEEQLKSKTENNEAATNKLLELHIQAGSRACLWCLKCKFGIMPLFQSSFDLNYYSHRSCGKNVRTSFSKMVSRN